MTEQVIATGPLGVDGKLRLEVPRDWSAFNQLLIRVEGTGQLAVRLNLANGATYSTIAPVVDRMLFPFENFFESGPVTGWRDITGLTLQNHHGGPVIVHELRLQHCEPVAGPRLRDVFSVLDLPAAGWRQHFLARTKPVHSYREIPKEPPPLESADAICRHQILGHDFGKHVDWRANPQANFEWTHALNRHYFIADLLHAYQATHDPKYAVAMDELLASWIAANPAPVDHNGGNSAAWTTLSAGCRFKRTWLNVFFNVIDEPAFRDSTLLAMLASIYEHAEFLMQHSGSKPSNWTIIEASALATIGIVLPEFRRAAAWRTEGLARLACDIERQVYPDGIHFELSPGYHMSSATAFSVPFKLAQQNGIELPALYATRLRAMYQAMADLQRPDGTLPSHNDSGGYRRSAAEFIRDGEQLFGALTPAMGSHAFRNAGLYVMRDGDKWALFDGGPFGAGHQHEDRLGLEIYVGEPVLVDPGISGYAGDMPRYYKSTAAHNTVLIDGQGQLRAKTESRQEWTRDVAGENGWYSSPSLDLARSQQVVAGVLHRRVVMFLKPRGWLVVDEFEGDGEHSFETLWHFGPLPLKIVGRSACCPLLEVVPLELNEAEVQIAPGWVADGADVPAPCVKYRSRGRLPVRQVWALQPK